jgi:hypothetical protein
MFQCETGLPGNCNTNYFNRYKTRTKLAMKEMKYFTSALHVQAHLWNFPHAQVHVVLTFWSCIRHVPNSNLVIGFLLMWLGNSEISQSSLANGGAAYSSRSWQPPTKSLTSHYRTCFALDNTYGIRMNTPLGNLNIKKWKSHWTRLAVLSQDAYISMYQCPP